MRHFKLLTLILALFAATVEAPRAGAVATDPTAFITDLGDQGMKILRSGTDLPHRKAAFAAIFTSDFDVPAIGKFVLGRYWKTATPEQQQEYLSVFGQYVVTIYAERFAGYQGEQFKVLGAQANDAQTTTVKSQILRTDGGPPVAVDWQVAKEGDGYKILNVIVENLSMTLTERQEFASVIDQHNGNVQALIDQLKSKLQ